RAPPRRLRHPPGIPSPPDRAAPFGAARLDHDARGVAEEGAQPDRSSRPGSDQGAGPPPLRRSATGRASTLRSRDLRLDAAGTLGPPTVPATTETGPRACCSTERLPLP